MTDSEEVVVTRIPTVGPISATIFILGEQPGGTERIAPFTGPAGRELDLCLREAGIARQECRIGNVIGFRGVPLERLFTKKGFVPEVSGELDRVRGEIAEMPNLRVIVAVGNAALRATMDLTGIEAWQMSVLTYPHNHAVKVVPVVHPATVIPPKMVFTNRYLIIEGLRRANLIAQNLWTQEDFKLVTDPTFDQVVSFINTCKERKTPVGFDIETTSEGRIVQLTYISLSVGKTGLTIPLARHANKSEGYCAHNWTPIQEQEILERIQDLLEDPTITKLAHNLNYDVGVLEKLYGITCRNAIDTMVLAHTINPDYEKGLDMCVRMYTTIPHYKGEGKFILSPNVGRWSAVARYSAMDSYALQSIYPPMWRRLENLNNVETFWRKMRILDPIRAMNHNGVRVDVEGMRQEISRVTEVIEQLRSDIIAEVSSVITPTQAFCSSSQQINQYFEAVGLKSPFVTKSGRPAFDKFALRALEKRSGVARKLLEFRKVATYRNFLHLDKVVNGRIYTTYNPVGTRFSRLSSAEPLHGPGINMQNIPHDALRFFLPEEGHIFVECDLAQAENTIVAFEANEPRMIECFEHHIDTHSRTASLFFGHTEDKIKADHKARIPAEGVGDGTLTMRDWGKRGNHALNYDMGPIQMARLYALQVSVAKKFISIFHLGYPGIRNTFHRHIIEQLHKTRTVRNLMGRTTVFRGRLDRDLYKQAFDCVPQGTVGDIIDKATADIWEDPALSDVIILCQRHDSLGFSIPLAIRWEAIADRITRIIRHMSVELTSTWNRKFTIPVEVAVSQTMQKEGGFEVPQPITAAQLKTLWEKKYGSTSPKLDQGVSGVLSGFGKP